MWIRKRRDYYISYKVILENGEMYGTYTINIKGLPDIGLVVEKIKEINISHDVKHVAILSCTEVSKKVKK